MWIKTNNRLIKEENISSVILDLEKSEIIFSSIDGIANICHIASPQKAKEKMLELEAAIQRGDKIFNMEEY